MEIRRSRDAKGGWIRLFLALITCLLTGLPSIPAATIVRFTTVMGTFDVQLFDAQMPRTVTNFLSYVAASRYNGTGIHRASDTYDTPGGPLHDFVIQGGGYSFTDGVSGIEVAVVASNPPILDEPGGGVAGPSNRRGTLTMAKSGSNTVTCQWFINQAANTMLDSPTRADGGNSAFGAVLGNGMTVVDAIGDLPLPADFGFAVSSPFNDLPLRNFSGSAVSDIRVTNTVTVTSVQKLTLPFGDINRDGVVNAADTAIVQTNLNLIPSGALLSDGDADMDGDVDRADLAMVQGVPYIVKFTLNRTNNAYSLQSVARSGKTYALQYLTNLPVGGTSQWTVVSGQGSQPGSEPTITFNGNTSALPAGKPVFFRVAMLP